MTELIMQIAIGVFIIIVGVLNIKGNVSLLHSYHRKRVREEDIPAFGKLVGIGTIIVGFTVIAAGIIGAYASSITNVALAVGFVPGIAIIMYALFKYNKGIF